MAGVREHVDHARALQDVAALVHHDGGIARQRGRITGHVDDAARTFFGSQQRQRLRHGLRAFARRVDQHAVEVAQAAQPFHVHLEQVQRGEAGACRQSVARGGLEGAVGQHLAAFHAHRLAALGRQRQREIAQTAEQVGDAVGGLHFQQGQRARHHRTVDRVVDLREIGGTVRHAQAEFRHGVGQCVGIGRLQRVHGVRPLGLEPPLHLMPGRERAQDGDIAVGQRQQMTQHQRGHALAQRNLDLRHAIGRGHRGDHGAQGQQQVADVARQHMAFAHVGHIAALALMEAHQHAALRHHPHRQAGAVAVAPGWALQGRQHARGTELADVPEGVLQRTLLDRHLGAGLQVLHGTAATDAKVRAARHHALRGRTQDLLDAGDFIGRLAAHGGGHHAFARQGALHEHDLALAAGDAAGFQVKGFDIQNVRHLARSRITCNRAL